MIIAKPLGFFASSQLATFIMHLQPSDKRYCQIFYDPKYGIAYLMSWLNCKEMRIAQMDIGIISKCFDEIETKMSCARMQWPIPLPFANILDFYELNCAILLL